MKKPSYPAGDLLEGFSEWLETREGLESKWTPWIVSLTLWRAQRLRLLKKKIIWPDGQRLSIEQSVERIHKNSGLDRQAILSRLIGWLQMEYEPEGLDADQMQRFENQIDAWIAKYDGALPTTSDF
jgi:hypothetical protein